MLLAVALAAVIVEGSIQTGLTRVALMSSTLALAGALSAGLLVARRP
jgi:hypothetical protein